MEFEFGIYLEIRNFYELRLTNLKRITYDVSYYEPEMRGIFTFILSVALGYILSIYLSDPKKKKIKWLKIRIGPLEISPNHRIHWGNKTYWIHHWLLYSIIVLIPLLAGAFVNENFQFPRLIEGMIVGAILQGLRYPDRFKFRHPRIDLMEIEKKLGKKIYQKKIALKSKKRVRK